MPPVEKLELPSQCTNGRWPIIFKALLYRATLNWLRNPFLYKAKVLKLIINIVVGVALFWDLGTSNVISV